MWRRRPAARSTALLYSARCYPAIGARRRTPIRSSRACAGRSPRYLVPPCTCSHAGHHRRRAQCTHAVPVHAAGHRPDELNAWAPRLLAKLQTLPVLADVATDQQTNSHAQDEHDGIRRRVLVSTLIDRSTLEDAFGQAVTQYYTQLNATSSSWKSPRPCSRT